MRRILTALVLTATLTATLVLAGCSLLPFGNDDPTSGGSDGSGGSSGQTGDTGQGGDADDDAVVSGSGQLPAGWPTEVFVPDGEVTDAVGSPGNWVAVIAVEDAVAAFNQISAELKGAGFTALSETSGENGSIGVYQNETYQVQVLANQDSGTPSVTYTIVEKG